MKFTLALSSLLLIGLSAQAQYSPRPDDHFWRKRIIMRLDLREKVNKPLVEAQSAAYVKGADKRYGARTGGLVKAIVDAWSNNRFTAYKGDSLHRSMLYSEFVAEMQKLSGGPTVEAPSTEGDGGDGGEDFEDFEEGGDEFGGEDGAGEEAAPADAVATTGVQLDLGNLQYVLELIEDRLFDKGRGVMVHDIDYVRLVWIDPDGNLPDKNLVAFKYDDVLAVLDETQWKNRFNDAEDRTIREIFDQRLFNSYVAAVSQNEPGTLFEADRRRQQMIEFEHHLWSY